jgi:hypothetical protein
MDGEFVCVCNDMHCSNCFRLQMNRGKMCRTNVFLMSIGCLWRIILSALVSSKIFCVHSKFVLIQSNGNFKNLNFLCRPIDGAKCNKRDKQT